MQTIERLLRVTGSVGEWTNELGKPDSTPEIAVGVCAKIRLDLRSPEGDDNTHILLPLPEADVSSLSYYLALDSDYLQETPPRLLSTENIQIIADEQHTYLEAVLPNTARQELLDALTNNESVSLNDEIGGYSGGNDPTAADFVIQFPLLLRNRVYLGTGDVPPEVEEDPRYLTAEQVKALIAEALRPPKGDKGDTGAKGDKGDDGADGQMLYATCGTASATVAKVATLVAGTLTLKAGATVAVRFTNANNAASPTLNISGTGAKAIYTQGVRYAYWAAGATVIFTYDGTYWRVASEPVYASTATIGNPGGKNIYIDGNAVSIRNGNTVLAKFTSENLTILDNVARIGDDGIYIRSDPVVSLVEQTAHFDGCSMVIIPEGSSGNYYDVFNIIDGRIDFVNPLKNGKPLLAFSDYEVALSNESVLINSGARSDLVVTFSKSHDSAPDVILATPFTSTGGGVECAVKNFTSTGFTANMKNGGASAAYFKVCYFAIWL